MFKREYECEYALLRILSLISNLLHSTRNIISMFIDVAEQGGVRLVDAPEMTKKERVQMPLFIASSIESLNQWRMMWWTFFAHVMRG